MILYWTEDPSFHLNILPFYVHNHNGLLEALFIFKQSLID